MRAQAPALISSLSIAQIRQDFSQNQINALQTGSSNLALADTNEEAANSQALSTASRSRCPHWGGETRRHFFLDFLAREDPGMKKSTEGENLGFDVNSIRT